MTRGGLCGLIDRAPDLVLTGKAGTLPAALSGIAASDVALIVVEPLTAPDDERALIAALSRAAPTARILALSARAESGYVERILEAGASGFVSKNEPNQRVLLAMRDVLAGKTVLAGVHPGRKSAPPRSGSLSE